MAAVQQNIMQDAAVSAEMKDFETLLEKVAELPAEEQRAISFYIDGYVAASALRSSN